MSANTVEQSARLVTLEPAVREAHSEARYRRRMPARNPKRNGRGRREPSPTPSHSTVSSLLSGSASTGSTSSSSSSTSSSSSYPSRRSVARKVKRHRDGGAAAPPVIAASDVDPRAYDAEEAPSDTAQPFGTGSMPTDAMIAALAAAGAQAALAQSPSSDGRKSGTSTGTVLLTLVGVAAAGGLGYLLYTTITRLMLEIKTLREELDASQLTQDEVTAIARMQIEQMLEEPFEEAEVAITSPPLAPSSQASPVPVEAAPPGPAPQAQPDPPSEDAPPASASPASPAVEMEQALAGSEPL